MLLPPLGDYLKLGLRFVPSLLNTVYCELFKDVTGSPYAELTNGIYGLFVQRGPLFGGGASHF